MSVLRSKDEKRLSQALDNLDDTACSIRYLFTKMLRFSASKIALVVCILLFGVVVLAWRLLAGGVTRDRKSVV
jgi:hypothetical protein